MTNFEKHKLRLETNVKKHELEKLIDFKDDKIIINKSDSSFWASVFLIILVLLPLYFLIKMLLFEPFQIFVLLALLAATLGFGKTLLKITFSENFLTLNFDNKCFEIKNNNYIFNKLIPIEFISFKDIIKCHLENEEIYHRHSKPTRWIKIIVTDINKKTYISASFSNEYPETTITHNVKSLIDAIILENKQTNN